jgi:dolichyl-phosphate beta-glucosyltransferase
MASRNKIGIKMERKMRKNKGLQKQKLALSIVIPAYNEESRLPTTLRTILLYCDKQAILAEVIVVDDGSSDSTVSSAKSICDSRIIVLKNKVNRGKGFSVHRGLLAASHPLVLMTDSDLATPIEELAALLKWREKNYDIIIGSRNIDHSKARTSQPFFRRLLGRTFPFIVNILVLRGFKDTQCGFKLFTKQAAERIARLTRIQGYCFDVELLYIGKKIGYEIKEVAVAWIDQPESKVHSLRDGSRMIAELAAIRWNSLRGKYEL